MSDPRKEGPRDDVGQAVESGMRFGLRVTEFLDLCAEEWEVRRFDRTRREKADWDYACRPEAQ